LNLLDILGRKKALFTSDIASYSNEIDYIVSNSSFLILGGAGSIGQAVVKEIFKRNPKKLHVVDISENNLVELVRDIRSSFGYINGDFKTYALDIGSDIYNSFIQSDGKFDFVLNLSALKHVRSEKDPFTLMRMIDVNILNTDKTIQQSIQKGTRKYFAVSTDKAANPVNLMGASKRIMEKYLFSKSESINISTARFANVAFSDGSLLHSFNQRILKGQPIVAPNDVKRYFLTAQESGELCLMSCLLGETRDIFFPVENEELQLTSFSEIAERYLHSIGYEPVLCKSEVEARNSMRRFKNEKYWPCFFSTSDTTGEKNFEEFYTNKEELELKKFKNIGIVKNEAFSKVDELEYFEKAIDEMKINGNWSKIQLVDLFKRLIPEFSHEDKGKYLDSKM
jgi:FlaA1/EpsC-like NDP-sugar epimerase